MTSGSAAQRCARQGQWHRRGWKSGPRSEAPQQESWVVREGSTAPHPDPRKVRGSRPHPRTEQASLRVCDGRSDSRKPNEVTAKGNVAVTLRSAQGVCTHCAGQGPGRLPACGTSSNSRLTQSQAGAPLGSSTLSAQRTDLPRQIPSLSRAAGWAEQLAVRAPTPWL